MFQRMVLSLGLSVGMVITSGGLAMAGTATATLPVSMVVAEACTVSATAVDFGTVGAAPALATGQITVTCQSGVPYTVALNQGAHHQPSIGRTASLTGGTGQYLVYELYSDAARTRIWGDFGFGSTYSGFPSYGLGDGTAQALTVYGGTPGGSLTGIPAGTYQDTVTVTVHF
jgi:spore coat protein U-like protein